eukprot:6183653-Pleurochrysis_carterae.AAC.10
MHPRIACNTVDSVHTQYPSVRLPAWPSNACERALFSVQGACRLSASLGSNRLNLASRTVLILPLLTFALLVPVLRQLAAECEDFRFGKRAKH